MKHSEFHRAMREEFGEVYAAVLVREHWVRSLEGTPQDALNRGVSVKRVWVEVCEDLQVPVERRHGRGLIDPQD